MNAVLYDDLTIHDDVGKAFVFRSGIEEIRAIDNRFGIKDAEIGIHPLLDDSFALQAVNLGGQGGHL